MVILYSMYWRIFRNEKQQNIHKSVYFAWDVQYNDEICFRIRCYYGRCVRNITYYNVRWEIISNYFRRLTVGKYYAMLIIVNLGFDVNN